MSKGLVAFIVVGCLAVALFLYNSMRNAADEQRKRSDEIMQNFKTIDNSFNPGTSALDSANKDLLKNFKDTVHATGR